MIVRRCDDVMERQRRREKETAQSKTEFERVKEKKRLIIRHLLMPRIMEHACEW